MFFAKYIDGYGIQHEQVYHNFDMWHRDTFSPDTNIITLIDFKLHGKTYSERKECLRNIAIDFQTEEEGGISYGELADVQHYFRRNGKRYGLLKEFMENGIC